jgi:DNA repair exonuclease SbcCD ATPase subunit
VITFDRLEVRNFGVIERADLDLADQGLVLVRAVNNDSDAADSNGAGKTTLFHALSWVLFGEVVGASRPAEEIIREGASAAEVRLDFHDPDHKYGVTRRRTGSTSKLTLTTDGESTTERRQADTEDRIREIIGLDWQAFRNTVLYGQGDVKRFADPDTTDAERKGVLKRILRLERIDGALKRVREELKALRGERSAAEGNVRTERARFEAQDRELTRAEHNFEAWGASRDAAVARLEADLVALDEGAAEDRKLAGKVGRLEGVHKQLEARLASRDALHEEADAIIQRGHAARAAHREAAALVQPARRLVRERRDALDELDGLEVCPVCRTSIGDSEAAREHLATLRGKVEEAEADVQRLEAAAATAQEAVTAIETEYRTAKAKAAEEDRWVGENERIERLMKDANAATTRVAAVDARRAELVDRLDTRRAEENPHAETTATLRQEVQEARCRVKAAEDTLAILEAREPPLRFWEEAFSDRGLPSLALDSVVPFITEAANRYLEILADGDITVDVLTLTEQKTAAAKDAIDFRLTIEGTEDVRPSGGQRRKLSIAVDLALMDLVATREGAQIDLVLLDEILDGLDAEGKARVVTLLRHLREVRSSIFVISHDPTIAEHFERVVTVVKQGGKSTLETV